MLGWSHTSSGSRVDGTDGAQCGTTKPTIMRKEITKAKTTYCYSLYRYQQSGGNRTKCGVGSGWRPAEILRARGRMNSKQEHPVQAMGFWMFGFLSVALAV